MPGFEMLSSGRSDGFVCICRPSFCLIRVTLIVRRLVSHCLAFRVICLYYRDMPDIAETIAARLPDVRREAGMSQTDLKAAVERFGGTATKTAISNVSR